MSIMSIHVGFNSNHPDFNHRNGVQLNMKINVQLNMFLSAKMVTEEVKVDMVEVLIANQYLLKIVKRCQYLIADKLQMSK